MGRGRAGRLLAILAAVAALLLTSAPTASAHTELMRSDPPNGGMVAEGRTTLTLWFDESIGGSSTNVEVRTLGGLRVDSSFDLEEDGRAMVIRTPALERGSYVLDWHALSMVDGHASTGQVIFGSGLRPDVVATSGESPPLALVVARWVDLAALLVAIGAVAVGGRVLLAGGSAGAAVGRRVRRYAAYAGLVACYSGILTAFLRTRAAGTPLPTWVSQTWLSLTGSSWGNLWLLREVALVLATLALWRWRRSSGSAREQVLAGAALTVAVVVEGFAGHAAGLPVGSTVAAVMGAGHILAAGVWAGGLAVLAVTVLRAARRDAAPPRPGVWRAYSPRAALASGVLLATGLYQAGQYVPSLGSLDSGLYGKAVVVKVVLFGAAIALAGINTLLVNPGLAARVPGLAGHVGSSEDSPRRFTRAVAAEVAVLVVAMLAAGVLTSVPTTREVALATRPAVPHAENVDGLFVTVEAVPEGPGERRIVVRAQPTVLPVTAPVFSVEAAVTGPDGRAEQATLTAIEDGRYEGSVAAPETGRWSVQLRLHRQAHPDTVVSTTWEQSATADQLPQALRTLTGVLAMLILAALAAAAIILRRRRTSPGEPVRPHPTRERSMS